jgi:hypothetical protein
MRKTVFSCRFHLLFGKFLWSKPPLEHSLPSNYIFILRFCILVCVLYQGNQKNLPSQQLFKAFIYISYIFAAACFGPFWPSSGGIHNYCRKLPYPQRIRCFVLLGLTYCICLANTAFVYLICVCELSKRGNFKVLTINNEVICPSGGPGSIPGTTRKKIVGLERGSLSLVSTTEELLDRKVEASV